MGEDAYFMDFGYGTITKLKLINETMCKVIRDYQNTISTVRSIKRFKMLFICLYNLKVILLSDYLCTDQIANDVRVCGPIDTGSPLTIEEDLLEDDRR